MRACNLADSEQRKTDEQANVLRLLRGNEKYFNVRFEGESDFTHSFNTTMYEIFRSAAPQAVVEMSLERFSRYLSWVLVSHSPSPTKTATSYPVGANICRSLLANFQALGLFEPSGKTHLVGDDKEYWSLTPKGNAIYSAALIQEMEENALGQELSGVERDVFSDQEESVDADASE